MDTQAFLHQVLAIEAEKPSYKLGGSGTCDCIGLVMGALRRAGAGGQASTAAIGQRGTR